MAFARSPAKNSAYNVITALHFDADEPPDDPFAWLLDLVPWLDWE